MAEMVKKEIFNELRLDRDQWRKRSKYLEGQIAQLQRQMSDMRRAQHDQAREASSLASITFPRRA